MILAKLINMCLKESCFLDCWKVSSAAPQFKNVRETSMARNYHSVSLLSVIRKVFKILVNKAGLEELFVCRHPTDPTLDLPTENVLLGH